MILVFLQKYTLKSFLKNRKEKHMFSKGYNLVQKSLKIQ